MNALAPFDVMLLQLNDQLAGGNGSTGCTQDKNTAA